METCKLDLELIEVKVKEDEEKDDLQKYIEQTYQKLDEKCDLIIEKIKTRKTRKTRKKK